MTKSLIWLVVLSILTGVSSGLGQTLTFTLMNGQIVAGPKYQYEVWVKSSDGTSKLGSVLVYNNYNVAAFGSSVVANTKVTVTKNSTDFGFFYLQNAANDNTASKFAFSWTLAIPGTGVIVPSTGDGVLAFTVQIDIADQSQSSGINFDATLMASQQYFDNETTTWPVLDVSSTLDTPLPIQLYNFTAGIAAGSQVVLNWTTLSEKNNYGFEVQKSLNAKLNYQSIPGSFTKGNGTTIHQHTYSYTISPVVAGNWYYRLKQTDLNGTVSYSEGIQAGAGAKLIPKEFALDQNYPNPFNPTTNINFALPKDGNVTIEVFNILGQRVMTLAQGFHEAGYYTVPFDARQLSSGIYFYRMVTKETTFLKKMMLLK